MIPNMNLQLVGGSAKYLLGEVETWSRNRSLF